MCKKKRRESIVDFVNSWRYFRQHTVESIDENIRSLLFVCDKEVDRLIYVFDKYEGDGGFCEEIMNTIKNMLIVIDKMQRDVDPQQQTNTTLISRMIQN